MLPAVAESHIPVTRKLIHRPGLFFRQNLICSTTGRMQTIEQTRRMRLGKGQGSRRDISQSHYCPSVCYHYHTPLSVSQPPISITPPITITPPYHYRIPLSLSHSPTTITPPYHYHTPLFPRKMPGVLLDTLIYR